MDISRHNTGYDQSSQTFLGIEKFQFIGETASDNERVRKKGEDNKVWKVRSLLPVNDCRVWLRRAQHTAGLNPSARSQCP